MSADNWTYCPWCRERFRQADVMKEGELTPTLREDYEIGIYPDDTFYMSYKASCERKGCEFEFAHEREDKLPREPSQVEGKTL